MNIFSDLNSKFILLDYSPTHRQLLIRSVKSKSRDHNIDVLFKGVKFIAFPPDFQGLEVSVTEGYVPYQLEVFSVVRNTDYHIFRLRNKSKSDFFIEAMAMGVFHNQLEALESGIEKFYEYKMGDLISWYPDSSNRML